MTAFPSLSSDDQAALKRTAALLGVPLATLLRQMEQAAPPAPLSETRSDTLTPGAISASETTTSVEALAETTTRNSTHAPPARPLSPPAPARSTLEETSRREFAELSYTYDLTEEWASVDASPYRHPDHVANRNRNGFLGGSVQPPAPLDCSSPEQQFSAAVDAAVETFTATGGAFTSSLAGTAISALFTSGSENVDSRRVVDETGSVSDLVSNFNDADSSDWPLVPFPNSDGAHSELQLGTSRELVPVTFVSFDPLEPMAQARQKRGAFRSDQLREETHKTRQLKACLRCRMQRIRVSTSERKSCSARIRWS